MKTSILEQMPAWHFARTGRPLEKKQVDQAVCWVERAKRQTRRPAERELEGRGFEVLYQPLGIGGLRLRAKLNLRTKQLFIDPESEADLFQELDALGFPLDPSPKALILTHELFHLFCPRCPSAIAELAAHLYSAEVLGLEYFPGLLDLVHSDTAYAAQMQTA
jgi:hypothetical protein